MTNKVKMVLVAVGIAAVTSAQAGSYLSGDLLAGFSDGANDFIFDLGQASTLTLGKTWNVGSNLGSKYGVVGSYLNGPTAGIYATSPQSNEGGFDPTGAWSGADTDIRTLAGGSSAIAAGEFRNTTSSDATGWTVETMSTAPGVTFANDVFNPNVDTAAKAYFFDNNNNGTVTPLDFFSYNSSSGILTYSAVPEPSTWALSAAAGFLFLIVRRKVTNA